MAARASARARWGSSSSWRAPNAKEPGLIFTLEESPEQLEATADALGLALRKWIEKGLVEIVYLSPGRVRAAQFLTILGDKIRRLKARRVLLDGVTYMDPRSEGADGLRQLLSKLVTRFKRLDVTSLLTAESRSLYFGDNLTERGFSPVADNLLMLRYVPIDDQLTSAHQDREDAGERARSGDTSFSLGKGGGRIMGDQLEGGADGTEQAGFLCPQATEQGTPAMNAPRNGTSETAALNRAHERLERLYGSASVWRDSRALRGPYPKSWRSSASPFPCVPRFSYSRSQVLARFPARA